MERQHLIKSYITNMSEYLNRTTDKSSTEIDIFIKSIIKTKFTDPLVTNVVVDHNNDGHIKKESLWKFINQHKSNIITPCGAIYKPATQQVALVKNMITERLKQRSVVKKEMLKAKAEGNKKVAKIKHYEQATIKIGINSLPGGMGSPYNCFYDRSGYNAITSSARMLIGESYTVCEQLLGGNFAWYTTGHVVNHIVINLNNKPTDKQIQHVVTKYRLKNIKANLLIKYFVDSIKLYDRNLDETPILKLVKSMNQQEINYLYYMGNLRHILWDNSSVFKPWIASLVDISNLDLIQKVNPQDLYKLDSDLVAVLTATHSSLTEGLQFYDLPKVRPDLACKFVIIGDHYNKCLQAVDELFDTLVYYPTNIPTVNDKKHMYRNTTVASDTDSVLFTTKDWMDWFGGDIFIDSPKHQQITSLVVYWLTKATVKTLNKFSIQLGATEDDIYRMKMKSEFNYKKLLLFPIKKTYLGNIAIQEGVVLPEPMIDIKGANLRSSSIPAYTTNFINSFIVNDILADTANGKLSAIKLIKKVVNFEYEIRKSVLGGSVKFLKMTSINYDTSYANPLSTAYFYYLAWNQFFDGIHPHIRVPTKCSIVPLVKITTQYKDIVLEMNKIVAKNMDDFVNQYKKFPSNIAINDTLDKIPKELIPIIDTRAIIFNNVKPLYLILAALGIEPGFEKQKLLLSDIY